MYLVFKSKLDLELLFMLIDCPQVDINARVHDGVTTVLGMACLLRHLEIVHHILQRPDLDMDTIVKHL